MDLDTNVLIGTEIQQLLADEKWHHLSEFLEFGEVVPGEIAARKFITTVRKGNREEASQRPIEEQVEQGRRCIVMKRLHELVRVDIAIKRGNGFGREYKKKDANSNSIASRPGAGDDSVVEADEQSVVQHYNSAKSRATKLGAKLEYNPSEWLIKKGKKKISFPELIQVSAFLEGMEWSNGT